MPRSSREKSEETRARLVDAAYRQFITHGYHATSMRDISQLAGLTVGAIYNHFSNKEELWIAVLLLHHPYREIFPVLQGIPNAPLSEMVRSAAETLVGELRKHPDLLNLMLIEIVEFDGKHAPLLFQTIVPEVAKMGFLLDGKEDRVRDIPLPTLLRSFVGLFFSYYITGMLLNKQPGFSFNTNTLDQFVDLYLYGVLAEDDPSRKARADCPRRLADLIHPSTE